MVRIVETKVIVKYFRSIYLLYTKYYMFTAITEKKISIYFDMKNLPPFEYRMKME